MIGNYEFDDEGRIVIPETRRVQLKPYIARPLIGYTLMTDQEIWDGKGGILIFDAELFKNFFLICFKNLKTQKIIKLTSPFNPQKLSWILHNYTVVGFNIIKFDLPLIWLAYTNQDTEFLKEVANELIFGNVWPQELQKKYDFKIHPTSHIDLIEVCPLIGSLKLYGARLHSKRIQDLPFPHDAILNDNDKEIVTDYCINGDLEATELIYNNLQEQLKLRFDLSVEYKQDLMSKSDAQIAEAVIGTELKKLTGKWPSKPKIDSTNFSYRFKAPETLFFQTPMLQNVLQQIEAVNLSVSFDGRLEVPKDITSLKIPIGNSVYRMGIGGLHSSEKNMSAVSTDKRKLKDRDVASYYPRIVLNNKLFPKHLGEPFLLVYNGIVVRRLTAKKAKRIAESENLKVTINGTFGKTGSPYSILYAPEMTIQITVGGQLYLLMLIEALELCGIEVISANTDGILIYPYDHQIDELNNVVKMWEEITGFETEETNYKAYYARDVNAYMAIKFDDEVKGKNVYYDPWRGKSAKDRYWRFQKNPNAQICVEAIETLILYGIPIEKTIQECTDLTKFVSVKNVKGGAHKDGHYLGKVVRWYISNKVLGTINYITTGNKVPDTDGAQPCMDLPDVFPVDINYGWYIDRTIGLLQDMNYIQKPKQVEFF